MRAKILNRIENLKSAKNPEKRFEYLINETGRISKSESLKLIQDTQKNIDAVIERLTKDGKIFALDNDYVSKNYCGELINSLIENVLSLIHI